MASLMKSWLKKGEKSASSEAVTETAASQSHIVAVDVHAVDEPALPREDL